MIDNGFQYHWLTAYNRGRMSGHQLDWNNQPAFFKNYPAALTFALPQPDLTLQSRIPFFSLQQREPPLPESTGDSSTHPLTLKKLAALLLLTSALTAKSSFPQGEIWYRSNASAGALYPIECYLSTPGCDNLPAGTYHYDLLKPALNRLRKKLVPEESAIAGCNFSDGLKSEPQVSTIILSAVCFRTAWKYRERAYRYLLLDCGHLLENLESALQFAGLNFATMLDFDDATVNQHLKFDENREISLTRVHFQTPGVGPTKISESVPDQNEAATPKSVLESPGSAQEIVYSRLNEIHRATSPLLSTTATRSGSDVAAGLYEKVGHWHRIPENIPLPKTAYSYSESLSRRRSRRNFISNGKNLTVETLHLLLDQLLFEQPAAPTHLRPEILFSVNGIKDIANGFYLLDFKRRSYGLYNSCDQRRELAAAALDQRWIANAALQFIFFADLESAAKGLGPRSYRHFNINAGRLGQRLYLGATALGLGACAVGAFYDRELAEVCLLEQNLAPLYLVAVGPVAGK